MRIASRVQKCKKISKKNLGRFLKKSLKIVDFLKYLFSIIKNCRFSNIFKKIFPIFLKKYFCSFELARQFWMSTDFVINFDFKNDWIIAVWKFQLWINLAYIWWKLLESDPKSEFSNGYKSVIFKVKIYDKISKHWELPRKFKNTKIFFFIWIFLILWKLVILKISFFNY